MATFDTLFTKVGNDLVELFGSAVMYHQHSSGSYDPLTGAVVAAETIYNVKAGVEELKRVEEGGTNETMEALLWFSYVTLPIEPTTADTVTYLGKTWKVTGVEPEYAGDVRIAVKIRVRAS
jgi:hypothetical protein